MVAPAKTTKPKTKKCRIDGCNGIAKWRGLCVRCYRSAWRLVSAGSTTWDDLVKRGLAESRGHERNAPILAKIRGAK